MLQRSFAEVGGFRRQEKVTRQEKFLEEMERVMPWGVWRRGLRRCIRWLETGGGLIHWRRFCGSV